MSDLVVVARIPVGIDRNINSIVNTVLSDFEQTEHGAWLYANASNVHWELDDDYQSLGMILSIYAEFETEMDAVIHKMRFGDIKYY